MPNWCSQNIILRGPAPRIQAFCDTVNSCLTSPPVAPNGFGRFWLGNICNAFGYDRGAWGAKGNLRGLLNAAPDAPACFFGPGRDERALSPEPSDDGKDSEVRFSIGSAWYVCTWFWAMIHEKFPEFVYGWKAEDEFGSFHEYGNTGGFDLDLSKYDVDVVDDDCYFFAEGQEKELAELLSKATDLEFSAEDFLRRENGAYEVGRPVEGPFSRLAGYNDSHPGKEVYLTVWEENTDL